jgi:hypothetical protein
MKLHVAYAPSAATSFWKRDETTWADILEWVVSPRRDGNKDGPSFVGGLLNSPRRHRDTIVSRSIIALDADHMNAEEGAALLANLAAMDIAAAVYSTFSHTPEAPRYRVLILPGRDLSPDEYWTVTHILMRQLGWDFFDHSSAQAERLMYLPSAAPGGPYYANVFAGDALDVDAVLALDGVVYDIAPRRKEQVEVPGPVAQPRTVPEEIISDQVKSALRGLDALCELPEGGRHPWPGMPDGIGWDLGTLLLGERLIQAANSGGSYTYEQAREDFMAHAPESIGSYDRDYKWEQAVKWVGTQPIPYVAPSSNPADEFTKIAEGIVLSPGAALELQRLRDRDTALEVYRRERAAAPMPRDSGWLRDVLKRPEEPQMRVEGLVPWGASTLTVAKRKIGKTTFNLNLVRCLITGDPFLGRFAVRPVEGTIAMLNYEVSGATLARWADEHSIDPDRFYMVNLRGHRNPLNHPDERASLAAELQAVGTESLIVDPFGRAFTGTSQNDAGEVGSFLTDLDTFARTEVGAVDLFLTTHAGWDGERTRGSSALEDWPDSIITMTESEKEPGVRFLSAMGRDVELGESRLTYDNENRLLTLGGGSRKDAEVAHDNAELKTLILEVVGDSTEGLTGAGLMVAVGRRDGAVAVARDELVESGALEKAKKPGQGGGWVYKIVDIL